MAAEIEDVDVTQGLRLASLGKVSAYYSMAYNEFDTNIQHTQSATYTDYQRARFISLQWLNQLGGSSLYFIDRADTLP